MWWKIIDFQGLEHNILYEKKMFYGYENLWLYQEKGDPYPPVLDTMLDVQSGTMEGFKDGQIRPMTFWRIS